ncbi:jg25465 [Pararge aegeria aegeria]|uniref:Jg25465 protein n=1 Tax=Pararge aegeria aegeria TaxID=348720 RepID=A0A8S4QWN0_9NEOP|nr:jg25465 [Pararge aegeria aegeria]
MKGKIVRKPTCLRVFFRKPALGQRGKRRPSPCNLPCSGLVMGLYDEDYFTNDVCGPVVTTIHATGSKYRQIQNIIVGHEVMVSKLDSTPTYTTTTTHNVGRPQRGGQMTSGESLGAAGGKRPRTVDGGTPLKRPMSSSGRQLVKMMMMM